MKQISLPIKILLVLLIVAVYGAGLRVKVMDMDASSYASMSQQVAVSHDFFKTLFEPPGGYLDKPPLIFLLAALSFKLFGVSTIAYKLPSLLLTLLGFFATFRLGAMLYNRRTGVLAAVMLCCCEAFMFFTNDVRTDANLTAAVIFAVWQLAALVRTKKKRYFFGGFIGIAAAMLAKGPIGLMAPLLAIGSWLVGRRDYRVLAKWYWPAGALFVVACLTPMLRGLYDEYGWKGIKFYFWTQSFGRLTGANASRNSAGFFFFFHTFLWAFLPWAFIAYYAVYEYVMRVVKKRLAPACAGDMLLLGGAVIPFLAFCCSHYKLPHYLFVIFPLVAIMTARTVIGIFRRTPARRIARAALLYGQLGCCFLGWVFALVVMTLYFPCKNPIVWLLAAAGIGLTIYCSLSRHTRFYRVIFTSLFTILGVNLMLNTHFYPQLLSYQGGSTAAEILLRHHAPVESIRTYATYKDAFDFYLQAVVPALDSGQVREKAAKETMWLYTDGKGYALLRASGCTIKSLDSFPDYHVTLVTPRFLSYKTRPGAVKMHYVINTVPGRANR